jgi:hypothetical protein
MDELLNAYLMADRLGPALALLAIGATFAMVRHSERIKPVKDRQRG